MKRCLSRIRKKKPEDYYDRCITLTLQKKQLSDVMSEVEALDKERNASFDRIRMEANLEEELLNAKEEKKETKRQKRRLEKAKRKVLKEKRIIERLQPVPTHITYDARYGIDMGENAFIVSQSHVTYDESEIDHSLDGEGQKGDLK